MRHWMILGLLVAAVACSSERDPGEQNGDDDGGDQDLSNLTCDDFNDYVDGCYADAGCPGAFVNLHDRCEEFELTVDEMAERVGEGCDNTVRFFCVVAVISDPPNTALFSLPCCQAVYACPDDLICDPVDPAGICITPESSFPDGARTCTSSAQCDIGFTCVQGETSKKCVQICYPE